jgi:hypothetical protein
MAHQARYARLCGSRNPDVFVHGIEEGKNIVLLHSLQELFAENEKGGIRWGFVHRVQLMAFLHLPCGQRIGSHQTVLPVQLAQGIGRDPADGFGGGISRRGIAPTAVAQDE